MLAQEEFAVADPADTSHAADILQLIEGKVRYLLNLLIGEYTQLVCTLFASLVTAELTIVLVSLLQILIADDTADLVGEFLASWHFEGEDGIRQLEAHFLITCSAMKTVRPHELDDVLPPIFI